MSEHPVITSQAPALVNSSLAYNPCGLSRHQMLTGSLIARRVQVLEMGSGDKQLVWQAFGRSSDGGQGESSWMRLKRITETVRNASRPLSVRDISQSMLAQQAGSSRKNSIWLCTALSLKLLVAPRAVSGQGWGYPELAAGQTQQE
jgi:hypothetical protein